MSNDSFLNSDNSVEEGAAARSYCEVDRQVERRRGHPRPGGAEAEGPDETLYYTEPSTGELTAFHTSRRQTAVTAEHPGQPFITREAPD